MKRIIVSLSLMLLVVLPVMAQTDEPSLGVHGILNNGETVSGDFSDESGMHLYTFSGNAGDAVTVRMESDDTDPFLLVLGSNGEVLGSNDDSDGLNAEVAVTLPDSGLYFVAATSYRSLYLPESEEGSYQLTLNGSSASDVDFEAVLLDPPLSEVEYDSAYDVQLSADAPVFMTYLTVQDSVSLSVSAISDTTDTLLYIFDENGDLLSLDDDSAGVGYSAAVNVSLDEPGRYVIIATQRDYLEAIDFGAFQLVISRS